MSENQPSPTAPDGRDARGRFVRGNKAGTGNPLAQQAQRLRVALYGAVSVGELKQVVRKLLELALSGDVQAIRTLLDRLLGPAESIDFVAKLEEIEAALAARAADENRFSGG
jgi:hypothetical protein